MMADRIADALIDASYLVALGYPRDRNHAKAKAFAANFKPRLLMPDVVLVEAIYNLQRLGGVEAAVHFSRMLIARSPRSCHSQCWISPAPLRLWSIIKTQNWILWIVV
jgi:predicted nucleic acid-binding protein